MKNKFLLTLVFLLIAIFNSQAQQIEVNLHVSPPYQLNLDGLANQLLATVRNTTQDPVNGINFRLELYGPKGLTIRSNRVFDENIDLEAGEVRQFIGNDWDALYESTDLTIEPFSEEQRIIETQSFREGSYKICLIAYSLVQGEQVSSGAPSDCEDFTVEAPEPPKIIFPGSNYKIPSEDFPLIVNWTQLNLKTSPTYTLEIVDATEFSHSSFAVEEMFSRAELVFQEDDVSGFSFVVEDVDWEVNHEYEIRVTSRFGESEGVVYDYKIHSRPVRVSFEGNEAIADVDVPDTPSEPEDEPTEPETETEEVETVDTETTDPVVVDPVVTDPIVEPVNDTPSPISNGDTIYVGNQGEFALILSELTGTKAAYGGKGTVFIDWLQARVNVSFKKITVAANKRLLSGDVIADISEDVPTYPINWALDAISNTTWSNKIAGEVVDWVENTTGEPLSYQGLDELSTPLSMPFGLVFSAENQLALSEMMFNKDESKFNIIVAKTTPLDWGEPQTIGFIAQGVSFHPASIEPTPKRLELVADLFIDNAENTSYTFIAPTDNRIGSYIEWSENGFSKFGLELDVDLSRDWLIPLNDKGTEKVKVSLATQSAGWDDLLFTGNLPKSEIVGSGGIVIEAGNISYDMSDVLNATGITFPTNYQGETGITFRGFYAKTMTLNLPEAWETSSNGALEINATNMILDNTGVTIKADVKNVADFNTTSVVDMAASVDNIHVAMVSNSLTDAEIKGKIALPITDVTKITDNSKIDYTASLHIISPQEEAQNKHSYFQLTLNPTEDQEIDFDLIHSKFKLAATSNIVAKIEGDKKTFTADLTGGVNITDIEVGPLNLNSVGMNVEHMVLTYDSSPTGGFTFDKDKKMAWTFSSPQKALTSEGNDNGFSLTFLSIDYENRTKANGEIMRGALLVSTKVGLSKNISGEGTIAITAAIKEDTNSFAKFKPVYIKTALDSLYIEADVSAVKIIGSVSIREDDPIYGNGFRGELNAQFKTLKAGISAIAEFGTVSDYKYWRVQAGLDLPTPIVLAAGVSFYGVGGGAYYNMKAIPNTNQNASWVDKYTFTPQKNMAGLNLKARLGAPKIETYNADVEIRGAIGTGANAGLQSINFNGQLWVGAEVAKRSEAPIRGNVSINYDFENSIFDLTTNATIKMKAITANEVGMQIYANGTNGNWFFKFGDPTKPNTVNVNLLGLGVNVDSYFMFGNHIPIPEDFTSRFKNGYKNALGHEPGFDPTTKATSEGSNAQFGAGIALGVGFNFKAGGYLKLPLNYYAGINGTAGAELNLSLLEYDYLKSINKGYNGWQAGGSIGFYASVAAGVYEKNGENYDPVFEIADFAGGGYVMGKFPNPTWAKGEIAGRVKLLCLFGGCLINSSVDVGFEYGEKIESGLPNIATVEAEENEMIIESKDAVLENMNKRIVKYIHPETRFSFSPTKPIAVKYFLTPNQNFEIPDVDKIRLFNFETEIVLQEINPLTCQINYLNLHVTTNDNGEKLYTAKSKLNWPGKGVSSSLLTTNSNLPASLSLGNNTILNSLAPQTNYKLVINTVLKEYKNKNWEYAKLEDKRIEETVEFKFRTSGEILTNELIEADALYTKMPIVEYYNMSIEDRYVFGSQFKSILNPTGKESSYISEDGECECTQLHHGDKLHFFSGLQEGFLDNPTTGYGYFPKAYRDYPEVNSTEDAITLLASQPIDVDLNVSNVSTNNDASGINNFSPTTFNYNTINTASSGSFLIIGNKP